MLRNRVAMIKKEHEAAEDSQTSQVDITKEAAKDDDYIVDYDYEKWTWKIRLSVAWKQMKADCKLGFYTDCDCFWLDQISRFWFAMAMLCFGLIYFYIVMKNTPPEVTDGYKVFYNTAELMNESSISFGFFFAGYAFFAVNYYGVFYIFPYLINHG